jgi:hypothetical protein
VNIVDELHAIAAALRHAGTLYAEIDPADIEP